MDTVMAYAPVESDFEKFQNLVRNRLLPIHRDDNNLALQGALGMRAHQQIVYNHFWNRAHGVPIPEEELKRQLAKSITCITMVCDGIGVNLDDIIKLSMELMDEEVES